MHCSCRDVYMTVGQRLKLRVQRRAVRLQVSPFMLRQAQHERIAISRFFALADVMHQHAADYKIVHVTLIWNWRLVHSPRHLRRNVPSGSGLRAMVRRVRRIHRRDVFIPLNRRRCTGKTGEDAAALGHTANELEQESHARVKDDRVDVLPYGVAGLSCLLLAAARVRLVGWPLTAPLPWPHAGVRAP